MNTTLNPEKEALDKLAATLADRILEQLCRHGWTMKTLSEKSGLPYETLKKIMARKIHNPSLRSVCLIADALECSIDELVGRA